MCGENVEMWEVWGARPKCWQSQRSTDKLDLVRLLWLPSLAGRRGPSRQRKVELTSCFRICIDALQLRRAVSIDKRARFDGDKCAMWLTLLLDRETTRSLFSGNMVPILKSSHVRTQSVNVLNDDTSSSNGGWSATFSSQQRRQQKLE